MASNTGGHFAVIHLNDTVRQGGPGGAWFGQAGRFKARRSWLGSVFRGGVWFRKMWFGQAVKVWSGLAGQGLVRLGPFRQGGQGKAWRGKVGIGLAWRSGSGVARPGVMRYGVASEA